MRHHLPWLPHGGCGRPYLPPATRDLQNKCSLNRVLEGYVEHGWVDLECLGMANRGGPDQFSGFDQVAEEARRELQVLRPKTIEHRDQVMFTLGDMFGLMLVHIVRPPNNGPNGLSTTLYLSYSFIDLENSPRIE